jgi:hypothetical protein
MHPSDPAITRLATAARRAELPAATVAPFGFSTRVLAQLAADSTAILWEHLGWRSLACAASIVAACLWWDFSATPPAPAEDDLFISKLTAASFQP